MAKIVAFMGAGGPLCIPCALRMYPEIVSDPLGAQDAVWSAILDTHAEDVARVTDECCYGYHDGACGPHTVLSDLALVKQSAAIDPCITLWTTGTDDSDRSDVDKWCFWEGISEDVARDNARDSGTALLRVKAELISVEEVDQAPGLVVTAPAAAPVASTPAPRAPKGRKPNVVLLRRQLRDLFAEGRTNWQIVRRLAAANLDASDALLDVLRDLLQIEVAAAELLSMSEHDTDRDVPPASPEITDCARDLAQLVLDTAKRSA